MAGNNKGFTLLELLIVIAVIAILSVILIFVLNPSETLAKARDTQRISDMATIKTAIGVYITTTSTPSLDGGTNTKCIDGSGNPTIFVSAQNPASGTISIASNGGTFTRVTTTTAASSSQIDGTGWVPVIFSGIIGGSAISNVPIDPTNTAVNGSSTAAAYTNSALMYRYGCRRSSLQFEVDARLESATYGPGGADDKSAKDGGPNPRLFEVGTDLTILPNSDNY